MQKVIICYNLAEAQRINENFNLPLNTHIKTFEQVKKGSLYGTKPGLILIDNAEMMEDRVFNKCIRPLLKSAKEVVITGSDITMFRHYCPRG
jgi:hypothetical protein